MNNELKSMKADPSDEVHGPGTVGSSGEVLGPATVGSKSLSVV